jgi:anti-sigma B factor antagonist
MKTLTVKTRKFGNVLVLDIKGKLEDSENNKILRTIINRSAEKAQNQILLNLENVSSIDSNCLSQLTSWQFVLNKTGGQSKLLHLPVNLLTTKTIKKLRSLFDVFESESEAIDSFRIRVKSIKTPFPETYHKTLPIDWGTRGMSITFLTEMMPNHTLLERIFTIKELLPSGRVTLNGLNGKYVKDSFEDVKYSIR